MPNIDELKQNVEHWEQVEKDGGSPSSAAKLEAAKAALAEAGGEIEEPMVEEEPAVEEIPDVGEAEEEVSDEEE
tara:strand:- start:673 stop:894 length:222 start_codon:yes stop_codon:yes gene_type:complete